jgi:hypothetical protein
LKGPSPGGCRSSSSFGGRCRKEVEVNPRRKREEGRWPCEPVPFLIEVKPEVENTGQVPRQLNTYRVYESER